MFYFFLSQFIIEFFFYKLPALNFLFKNVERFIKTNINLSRFLFETFRKKVKYDYSFDKNHKYS